MIKNNYLRFLLWYTVRANCHSFKNCRFYVLKVEFWELDFSLKISLFDFFNYIKSELLHQQNKSFNFFFFEEQVQTLSYFFNCCDEWNHEDYLWYETAGKKKKQWIKAVVGARCCHIFHTLIQCQFEYQIFCNW